MAGALILIILELLATFLHIGQGLAHLPEVVDAEQMKADGRHAELDGTGEEQYASADTPEDGAMSDDGQWRWDGSTGGWVEATSGGGESAEATSGGDESAVASIPDGQVSEDGQWRWDESSQDWVAVS